MAMTAIIICGLLVALGVVVVENQYNSAPPDHANSVYSTEPESDYDSVSQGQGWFKTIVKFILGALFKLLTLVVVGPVVFIVSAEGARYFYPVLGMKLHRMPLPGISQLRHFQGADKIDLANCFAITLCCAAWVLCMYNLQIILAPHDFFSRKRFNPKALANIIRGLGILVICSDATLMYIGLAQQGGIFGGSMFSFTAALGTIAYIGAIIVTAFISVMISKS